MPSLSPDAWLIVGLGNPGPAYSHNRHNVGYWCINRLGRRHQIRPKTRRLCTIGEGAIEGQPVVLAKPRTYMNRSGHALSALLKHYQVQPQRLLVVCDDLDLPLGKLRLRPRGGHAGHKGLQSIIAAIGTRDFPRLRIGIGRPQLHGQPLTDPDVIAVYVLSDPTPAERAVLEQAVAQAAEALEVLLREGLAAAMNRCNR